MGTEALLLPELGQGHAGNQLQAPAFHMCFVTCAVLPPGPSWAPALFEAPMPAHGLLPLTFFSFLAFSLSSYNTRAI